MDTIFILQAYEEESRVDQTLTNVTVVEVYAKTEKEAIDKAKQYIKKSHYRVSHIIEKKEAIDEKNATT